MANTSKRGFASMDGEKQRLIASKGGKAAHAKGTAHEWSSEEARAAGRKGGESRGSRGRIDEHEPLGEYAGTPHRPLEHSISASFLTEAGSSLRSAAPFGGTNSPFGQGTPNPNSGNGNLATYPNRVLPGIQSETHARQ